MLLADTETYWVSHAADLRVSVSHTTEVNYNCGSRTLVFIDIFLYSYSKDLELNLHNCSINIYFSIPVNNEPLGNPIHNNPFVYLSSLGF